MPTSRDLLPVGWTRGYGLRGRGELFFAGWDEVADRRTPSLAIVESFDEAEAGRSRGLAGWERAVALEFGLEAAEGALLDLHVPALEIDRLTDQQPPIDLEELARQVIAFRMPEVDAVATVLRRVAAGHHVDHRSPLRQAVERGGHPRGQSRRLQPGPNHHQIA
jgi:hypothetical protein